MRKIVSIIAVVTALMAMATAPAGATTGNYVEHFEYPFVGLVVFYDESGEFSRRSGGPTFYPVGSNVIVAVTSFGLNSW